MSYTFYELKDADDQDTNYKQLLIVWTPRGSFTFAVERVVCLGDVVYGYDSSGQVVTAFSKLLPFMTQPRSRSIPIDEGTLFERGIEDAQTQKMRKERFEAILGKPEEPRGY